MTLAEALIVAEAVTGIDVFVLERSPRIALRVSEQLCTQLGAKGR
jgi:hypothetical protein